MQRTPITSAVLGVGLSCIAAGCKPEFDDRISEVSDPRVLAITADPPEWVKVRDPNTGSTKTSTLRALVVSPQGVDTAPSLSWAFCTLPKPLTQLNDVSYDCFDQTADWVVPIGDGSEVDAVFPDNTCRQFGPDVPEQGGYRPADPDVTGGYYQPVRVFYQRDGQEPVPSLAKLRIRCGLPGASAEDVRLNGRRYHDNANPVIIEIAARIGNGDYQALTALEDDENAALQVSPGQEVRLRVSWPGCPTEDACGDGFCGPTESSDTADCTTPDPNDINCQPSESNPGQPGYCEADCATEPKTCGGAERYLAFDLASRRLGEKRESMRVSWYTVVGAGEFENDRTGRAEDEFETATSNTYTAPRSPGDYTLWLVLRDSRAGVTWKSIRIHVG